MSLGAYGLTAADLPQDPYYPQETSEGPSFLDTGACVCVLQETPLQNSNNAVWHCIGNQTQNVYLTRGGKFFTPVNGGTTIDGNIYDDSNGPQTNETFVWDSGSNSLQKLVGDDGLTPYDLACTGQNQTTFSTAFYRANQEIANNETAVDAAPCWRPGAIPVQIQNITEWQSQGCNEGFLCMLTEISALDFQAMLILSYRCQQHCELSTTILPATRRLPIGATVLSNLYL